MNCRCARLKTVVFFRRVHEAWRLLWRAAGKKALREAEGVRAALHEESQPLVLGRTRAVLCLGIVTIVGSILIDARVDQVGLGPVQHGAGPAALTERESYV